jgi:Mn2+/Fe2+ NRAMP family transporter
MMNRVNKEEFLQKDELRRGLPMVEARDPEALEHERQILREINARPHFLQRWRGYWGLSGPGWIQSALTLGAGSASSAIFAGAVYGYKLLWVQPVAMFLGVAMFAAIGHQLLITRARPYDVFWKRLHPSLALLWGFNVLLASIVWQFPQYSLGTAFFKDIFKVIGINMPKGVLALALLVFATTICWSYGRGSRKAIRVFERTLKYMLMLMVLSFFLVVIKTGVDWMEMIKDLFSFHIPRSREGITIVLGQLGAAVGVNMTFLYPYTLLARGWGKEHRGLKNFDLGTSMFIPFILATGFVTIACANTLHLQGIVVQGPLDAAHALEPLVGLTFGRLIFSFGILSMCLTTLIIEMLICGFVLSEMFRFEYHGWAYRASTMLANIGILGAFTSMPLWLPVIASSFNLVMMPIAYICFFILQNKKSYLGEEVSRGIKGMAWNIILVIAILVVAAGAVIKVLSVLGYWPG